MTMRFLLQFISLKKPCSCKMYPEYRICFSGYYPSNPPLLYTQLYKKHQISSNICFIDDQTKKRHLKIKNAIQDKKIILQKIQNKSKFILNDIKMTKIKVHQTIKENIWTIPNMLCMTRITLSPFLGYLIVNEYFEYALSFVAIASLTDWVDGWIARKFKGQKSKLGSFLDPMADKVLVGTMFLTLTYVNLIPLSLTSLIILRDLLLIGAAFQIRYKSISKPRTLYKLFDVTSSNVQLAPTYISKVNTTVQLVMVCTTLAAPVFDFVDHPSLKVLWWLTTVTTVSSAISYIINRKKTYKIFNKYR
ncbi:probable cardiolipin synthase (CMP-forming) [Daktulosphaira vitifoliae]|uniref:probable cardiolipin synthase (CMP-forming) n=1 Tax=Daktulosphaira vitifoliae TaxID=58002 RepID=UPI0021AAC55C|nr:probable cardiolipin synthase (CMP-forming) [Daktulosphaira vitifoliae]XP_050524800.1 probable cardiolipin synthase (CMP-forming) [Daktulosphaira vitifoliae]XP_050524801.1 probable cardiolipin synthase (CMP-forming) [Daktulosphaira vitifoliae]XP_050524802.1 probable cardiolipin synthase (CMP-forming) [Daktulosphaira vitifoliae]